MVLMVATVSMELQVKMLTLTIALEDNLEETGA